jgi:hypothetical protein
MSALAAAAGSDALTWTAALIAWVLAVPLFFAGKFLTVLAHEGGHAFLGLALFRGIKKITINTSGGGETQSEVSIWPITLLILAFGYLGPSLFGLLAAWLLLHDPAATVLWGSIAFLAVMLLATEGFLGPVLIISLMVALFQVVTRAQPSTVALVAHVWTWFLLISGVQRMFLLMRRNEYTNPKNDTTKLGKMTLVGGAFWGALLLVATVAALVYGGALLLRLTG